MHIYMLNFLLFGVADCFKKFGYHWVTFCTHYRTTEDFRLEGNISAL